jgi:hypothetical protein
MDDMKSSETKVQNGSFQQNSIENAMKSHDTEDCTNATRGLNITPEIRDNKFKRD